MLNKKAEQAYKIFRRIALSNKRTSLDVLETIGPLKQKKKTLNEQKYVKKHCDTFSRIFNECQIRRSRWVCIFKLKKFLF